MLSPFTYKRLTYSETSLGLHSWQEGTGTVQGICLYTEVGLLLRSLMSFLGQNVTNLYTKECTPSIKRR